MHQSGDIEEGGVAGTPGKPRGRLLGGRRGVVRLLDRKRLGPDAVIKKPVRFTGPCPRVSVVVPCYNYRHYLSQCVRSVLSQPGVDVDVVIVDDASTDGSPDLAAQLAESDSRVSVIRHVRNVGHIATYNDGLDAAAGDYLVLLSADDLLAPGSLARATALLETHPSVGFCYGHVVTFTDRPPSVVRERVGSWTVWPGRSWSSLRWWQGRNAIWSPEVVMRATVQRRIGGYRPEYPHTGDLEMWLRAAAVSDVGRVDGPDQAYYRLHPASMHATTFEGLADLKERRALFERLSDFAPGEEERRAARRALGIEALAMTGPLLHPAEPDIEAVKALLAFAEETFPEVSTLPHWQAIDRCLGDDAHSAWDDVNLAAQERIRRAKEITRRWWWQLVGV